ncbi:MAG TPA: 50S ribosomal protein L3 [Thermodesulfobacteriota bacterium]|nr:50S ribosomal protein L3 [Thermodesulfobacteriota bacterium]
MKKGIIGKKIGMTQLFAKDGKLIPVTVIQATPCSVVQKKVIDRDGYSAFQIGFEEIEERKVTKPLAGHFKKADVAATRYLREFRLEGTDGLEIGQSISVDIFAPGERVDIVGVSKGKGFAGGVKRHHFKGGGASHGSMHHRAPGSIGASSFPSRVFKGQRLPGHMGQDRVTTLGLEIIAVKKEQNLLLVKGAVPGAKNGLVIIRDSVKK